MINPQFGSNGAHAGCTAPVIRVYPPASASLTRDLLELSGAFTFAESSNGVAIFQLTAAVAGNTGRTIQCGGLLPTITRVVGVPWAYLVTWPSNVCLCWCGGFGVYNGLYLSSLPYPLLGLVA